jgi:aromatase
MTDLRIWTTRHTTWVAALPKRVFELVANVDRWPTLLDSLVSVEHLGFDGARERVRFARCTDGATHALTMARELNPKRMQVRFRQVDVLAPIASMGGFWLVVPKGSGSTVVLDHYYRVEDNDPAAAAEVERRIAEESTSMLTALRHTVEQGGMAEVLSGQLTTEGKP